MKLPLSSLTIVQFVRFGFGGLFVTAFYSALYLGLVSTGMEVMASHFAAYGISMVVGFLTHRFWTFREIGPRTKYASSGAKFAVVTLVGFSLNTMFVWLIAGPWLGLAPWVPLIPVFCVTPIVTFILNRYWTFS